MSGTTGTIPLNSAVADQLITSALWNAELANIGALLDAAGAGGHSGTDAEAQIQSNPFPGSVLSKATSTAGELERIRYQLAKILGTDYWYKPAATDLTAVGNVIVPVGGIIDFPVAAAPNANFHLADGTAISRAGYPALFSLIGTTFGVGDGSSTFNLPDYRDRMSIGAGNLYAAGGTGGSTAGALAITDPGHNHTQNSHTHTMGNHTHSTPNHQHRLDHSTSTGSFGPTVTGSVVTTDSDGTALATGVSGSGTSTRRFYNSQTENSGSGTSGAPSTNTNDATTPTNNPNTTGISGTAATLPPYLGMYKMMRVL